MVRDFLNIQILDPKKEMYNQEVFPYIKNGTKLTI